MSERSTIYQGERAIDVNVEGLDEDEEVKNVPHPQIYESNKLLGGRSS